jgi:phosphate transport system permease protein
VTATDGELGRIDTGAAHVRRSRLIELGFRRTTLAIGLCLIALLIVMLWELTSGAWRALSTFGLHFFVGTDWNPVAGRESFGALPFMFGTVVTSFVAIVIAVPVSVGLALFLNQVRGLLANPLAVFVDILAAIPSIVYGLWGLFVLLPWLDKVVEPFLADTIGKVPVVGALFSGKTQGPDIFTAAVILSIMILPIVTAVSREVIAVVPRDLREAALALGATRWESVKIAVLPYARSGIVGATMLGLGRALGETIAVTMVIGNTPQIRWSLFAPASTIPSRIASSFREASSVGLTRSALLALAVTLLLWTFLLALISRALVRKTERVVGDVLLEENPAGGGGRVVAAR